MIIEVYVGTGLTSDGKVLSQTMATIFRAECEHRLASIFGNATSVETTGAYVDHSDDARAIVHERGLRLTTFTDTWAPAHDMPRLRAFAEWCKESVGQDTVHIILTKPETVWFA